VYLLLILRLDLRNMPDMLLSASGSSKTAATTTKKSCCTASSTGFFTLPHARCSALHPQLPPTESSKQLHARFWQKSSYFICRSTSFSFASLALPLLELALVAPSPTKAKALQVHLRGKESRL